MYKIVIMLRQFFVYKKKLCYFHTKIPIQLNLVVKEVKNQNNRFISYIKTDQNKKLIFLFARIGSNTLDYMDKSYIVNYLYMFMRFDSFLLSFLLSFLINKELDTFGREGKGPNQQVPMYLMLKFGRIINFQV